MTRGLDIGGPGKEYWRENVACVVSFALWAIFKGAAK
jgi:hypothetical protein